MKEYKQDNKNLLITTNVVSLQVISSSEQSDARVELFSAETQTKTEKLLEARNVTIKCLVDISSNIL